MKKPLLYLLSSILLLFFVPVNVRAETDTTRISMVEATKTDEVKKADEVDVAALSERVAEIQAMDKSMLSREEKRALRTELSAIKSDLNAISKSEKTSDNSGGIYISVGALIIIILLLIIIF